MRNSNCCCEIISLQVRFITFRFFHRFDDELEQYKKKTQINAKRRNQHSSRESVIKICLEKDIKNFNAGGIELPDLCDPEHFELFKKWDGSAHSIQHLKIKFISKNYLKKLKEDQQMNVDE